MTPEELDKALETIGWSARYLAYQLGLDEATIRHWRRGDREVPAPIAVWLRKVEKAVAALPPPARPVGSRKPWKLSAALVLPLLLLPAVARSERPHGDVRAWVVPRQNGESEAFVQRGSEPVRRCVAYWQGSVQRMNCF